MNAVDNSVLRILRGDRKDGPVCSSPLVTVTLDQMKTSGCYYPDAHSDPEKMARLAGSAYWTAGFRGVRVPFDLCVEAEAFGCVLRDGGEESAPSVMAPAFAEVRPLTVPADIFQRGRFGVVFEAVRLLRNEFGNEVTVFPGIVGPLTLLGHLYDITEMMCWPIKDPRLLDRNLGIAADFLAGYARKLLESGGHTVIISDPSASGDLLSRKHFQRHVIPAYQRIRKMTHGPVILHICGDTNDFLEDLPLTGFEGFAFEGPSVSVRAARRRIGNTMALVGNIPTHDLLLSGTAEQVFEASMRALKDGVDLLAPACGIPVHSPMENLKAMVRAAEVFRVGTDLASSA